MLPNCFKSQNSRYYTSHGVDQFNDSITNQISNFTKLITYKEFARRFGYQDTTWDIEDLVRGGNREGLCPYFVSKAILGGVEIVFCPYNYLIDKKIRTGMEIDLSGQIIMLDEAHNIEDVCRDSASIQDQQECLL